jgi:hypothetical protein
MHSEVVGAPKRATSRCVEKGLFPSLVISMILQLGIIDGGDIAGETGFVVRELMSRGVDVM